MKYLFAFLMLFFCSTIFSQNIQVDIIPSFLIQMYRFEGTMGGTLSLSKNKTELSKKQYFFYDLEADQLSNAYNESIFIAIMKINGKVEDFRRNENNNAETVQKGIYENENYKIKIRYTYKQKSNESSLRNILACSGKLTIIQKSSNTKKVIDFVGKKFSQYD